MEKALNNHRDDPDIREGRNFEDFITALSGVITHLAKPELQRGDHFNEMGTNVHLLEQQREKHFQETQKTVEKMQTLISDSAVKNNDMMHEMLKAFSDAQDLIRRNQEEKDSIRKNFTQELKDMEVGYEKRIKEGRDLYIQLRADFEKAMAETQIHIKALQEQNNKLVELHVWKDNKLAEKDRQISELFRSLVGSKAGGQHPQVMFGPPKTEINVHGIQPRALDEE